MNTPRISTIAALVFKGDKVLLVRHGETAHHITGVYGLPGGRLEEGESLLDGVARELQEETGLVADKSSMVKLGSVYEADILRKNGEILSTSWHVFLVKNFNGDLKSSSETTPDWIGVSDISGLDLLPNVEKAVKEGLSLFSL